jgi:hypothetical protein
MKRKREAVRITVCATRENQLARAKGVWDREHSREDSWPVRQFLRTIGRSDFILGMGDAASYQQYEVLKRQDGTLTLPGNASCASGRAISASYDQTLRLWDLETGQTVLICTENTSKFRSVEGWGSPTRLTTHRIGSPVCE